MNPGTRGLSAAARAFAVFGLVGLLGVATPLGGCADGEDEPVMVARSFARAMLGGDTKALLPMLEPAVVARLELAAEQASDQVGGRRRIGAEEMLQAVGIDPTVQIANAELLERSDESARVKLIGTDGREWVLAMVLAEGSWRVKIPPPPMSEESITGDGA